MHGRPNRSQKVSKTCATGQELSSVAGSTREGREFCLLDAASFLRNCILSSSSGSCLRQRRGRTSVHGCVAVGRRLCLSRVLAAVEAVLLLSVTGSP